MKTKLLAALGASAVLAAVTLTPAAAQVRGVSAVGPSGSTRVDVNVRVETSDRYRDDRYGDAYYDDHYYDDGYYRDRAYQDRYYEDAYYRDRDRGYRRGEVYYPHQDNTGEVIAGVLVGAIIGYALADNDDHHHHYNKHYYSSHRYNRGHGHKKYHKHRRY